MEGFETASVTRQGEALKLVWSGAQLGAVKIYGSAEPDFLESQETFLAETEANSYECAVNSDERVYFMLHAANGARIRVAERVIAMEALVNFRDLGGYLTVDGRRTKWGKLLRSAAHDAITERDAAFLKKLGLKTVIDYRSSYEEIDHPDRELDGVRYLHLRPFEESNATNVLDVSQFQMASAEDAIAMMTATNRLLAKSETCNQVYRQVVELALEEQQVPMVQHCTAGKDRVGVGAATLLMALGVPRETIMADYLLSNDNRLSVSKLSTGTVSQGQQLTEEQLKLFEALTKVHAAYLEAFFDEVDKHWGGTEGYLQNALGLTQAQLEKMKDLYLETM